MLLPVMTIYTLCLFDARMLSNIFFIVDKFMYQFAISIIYMQTFHSLKHTKLKVERPRDENDGRTRYLRSLSFDEFGTFP